MMNYPDRLKNYPPILLRLLARKPYGPPLTTEEISFASSGQLCGQGIPLRVWAATGGVATALSAPEVFAISKATDWKGIGLCEALSFQHGCGIELHDAKDMTRVTDYLTKRPTFRYLRSSPIWATYYQPLFKEWRMSYPVGVSHLDLAPHILRLLKSTSVLIPEPF